MTGLEYVTKSLDSPITETVMRTWLSRWQVQADGRSGVFVSCFQLPTRAGDGFPGWAKYTVSGNSCHLSYCIPLWFPVVADVSKMSSVQHGVLVACRQLRKIVADSKWQLLPNPPALSVVTDWLELTELSRFVTIEPADPRRIRRALR